MENPSCWTESHRKIEAGLNRFRSTGTQFEDWTWVLHSTDIRDITVGCASEYVVEELWPRLDYGEPSVPTDPGYVIDYAIADWNKLREQEANFVSMEHHIYTSLKDLGFPV
jgi:hypothetical protein